jgi:hypothetical protein
MLQLRLYLKQVNGLHQKGKIHAIQYIKERGNSVTLVLNTFANLAYISMQVKGSLFEIKNACPLASEDMSNRSSMQR